MARPHSVCVAYENSPHSRVECLECYVTPGAVGLDQKQGQRNATACSYCAQYDPKAYPIKLLVQICDQIGHFTIVKSRPGNALLLHAIQHCGPVTPERCDHRDRGDVSLHLR